MLRLLQVFAHSQLSFIDYSLEPSLGIPVNKVAVPTRGGPFTCPGPKPFILVPQGLVINRENLLAVGWVSWEADAEIEVSKWDVYCGVPLEPTAVKLRGKKSRRGRGRS